MRGAEAELAQLKRDNLPASFLEAAERVGLDPLHPEIYETFREQGIAVEAEWMRIGDNARATVLNNRILKQRMVEMRRQIADLCIAIDEGRNDLGERVLLARQISQLDRNYMEERSGQLEYIDKLIAEFVALHEQMKRRRWRGFRARLREIFKSIDYLRRLNDRVDALAKLEKPL